MVSLKSGVLVKLLEDMKIDDDHEFERPVLLQIRSILPVLEEGDLWPNKGFFLKVSDASHAMYVSLSQEQNEMILGNKLKLGQFVYVQRLEKAHPVPLLVGITPVPGRHLCEGSPEDIVSPESLRRLLEAYDVDSVVEKGVISEKKISSDQSRNLTRRSSGPAMLEDESRGRLCSSRGSKARTNRDVTELIHFEKRNGNGYDEGPRCRLSSDNDSDTDSMMSISSAPSSRSARRRSWNTSEILAAKEIIDSSVSRPETKPPPRSRSVNVSPVRSMRYDSADDNRSSCSRRSESSSVKRLPTSTYKRQTPVSKVSNVQATSPLCSIVHDRKGAEARISWSSLPPSLVKLGKEVVRQRDVALVAAADALQEACAAERLLNSLRKLSDFQFAEEEDDLLPYVDRFFDFQDDLGQTRLIMQSLTSISPFRTPETEPCGTNSVKDTLKIAVERKKNAATWVKSAVALDLSLSIPDTTAPTNTVTKQSKSTRPKGISFIKTKRNSGLDFSLFSPSDKVDEQHEWTKWSTMHGAANLASSLQDECRKFFLICVEKYLDEVERKSSLTGAMMYNVKRVNDLLDQIMTKDRSLDESEVEAYGRIRNKIYEILLKHVERTAMELEK